MKMYILPFLDSTVGDAGDRFREKGLHCSPAGKSPNKSLFTCVCGRVAVWPCVCVWPCGRVAVCVCVWPCVCGRVAVWPCAHWLCLMISGAVDGGEAEGSRRSVRRCRGAFVSAVPGAAGLGAGEGGCHRAVGAAAGGAGETQSHKRLYLSNRWSTSGCFFKEAAAHNLSSQTQRHTSSRNSHLVRLCLQLSMCLLLGLLFCQHDYTITMNLIDKW